MQYAYLHVCTREIIKNVKTLVFLIYACTINVDYSFNARFHYLD